MDSGKVGRSGAQVMSLGSATVQDGHVRKGAQVAYLSHLTNGVRSTMSSTLRRWKLRIPGSTKPISSARRCGFLFECNPERGWLRWAERRLT